MFITAIKIAQHCTISWSSSIRFTTNPIYLRL